MDNLKKIRLFYAHVACWVVVGSLEGVLWQLGGVDNATTEECSGEGVAALLEGPQRFSVVEPPA